MSRTIWVWSLAVLAALFLLAAPLGLYANPYFMHIATIAFFYAILASSWSLLAGYAGQFSFAHMAFMGIGAYTAGLNGKFFRFASAPTGTCTDIPLGSFWLVMLNTAGETCLDAAKAAHENLQIFMIPPTLGIIAGVQEGLPDLPEDKVIRFEGGVNVDEAAEAVATQLEAHPEAERVLVGMLGDSNAVAALNYTKTSGRDVLAAGIGGDEVGIAALRTGEPEGFVGSTLFRPEQYGYDLIPLGCDLLAGKQIPPEL